MTQNEALAILKTGANVFLTGEPGSGKTHTVNEYVAYLRAFGVQPAITASTGIAATHIGGLTIHSWSGIGVRRDLTKHDMAHISQNRNVVRRVEGARILIIDEISMLSARTLAMVDAVCREIRRSSEPFGGLQTVFVGDFFQLPPVSRREEGVEEFAFQSQSWEALSPTVCYLSEQHRQEDAVFLEFLSALRRGAIVESHKILLRTRYSPRPKDGITQLYPHNADVDAINAAELSKLKGQVEVFIMTSRGPEKLVEGLKRGCLSSERLELKIGARVMFTKNDAATHRYANGTLGAVAGFLKETGYPIVKTLAGRMVFAEPDEWRMEDGGRVLARVNQVPLRLAWAMTVHKSQGMSLDAAHMDLSGTFEYGQGYVALSRVRAFAGLSLAGFNEKALEVHPEVCAKDEYFRSRSKQVLETFSATDSKEIAEMHTNFIRACGGKSGAGRASAVRPKKISTYEATKELVLRKMPLADVARKRGLAVGTVIDHLENLVAQKSIDPFRDLSYIKCDERRFDEIRKAFETVRQKEKQMSLSAARAMLGEGYSYDELRLARLFMGL